MNAWLPSGRDECMVRRLVGVMAVPVRLRSGRNSCRERNGEIKTNGKTNID